MLWNDVHQGRRSTALIGSREPLGPQEFRSVEVLAGILGACRTLPRIAKLGVGFKLHLGGSEALVAFGGWKVRIARAAQDAEADGGTVLKILRIFPHPSSAQPPSMSYVLVRCLGAATVDIRISIVRVKLDRLSNDDTTKDDKGIDYAITCDYHYEEIST
jgi:hypothetical protein